MSGAGRGVIWNGTHGTRADWGRGVPLPAREDTPGPVVYRILNGRLAEVGAYAKTLLRHLEAEYIKTDR